MRKEKTYMTDFFLLRYPLCSLNGISKIYEAVGNKDITFIKHYIEDKDIMEAIYLASPVLFTELKKVLNGKRDFEVNGEKLYESLVKYLVRSSSRSTPFGLFASCSLGQISKNNRLKFVKEKRKKNLRLDMDFLCSCNLPLASYIQN